MPEQPQITIPTLTSSSTSSAPTSNEEEGQKFLKEKIAKLSEKADKIYSSSLYEKVRPENKRKIDDALYTRYSDTLKFMGRTPPNKAEWDSQPKEKKLEIVRSTDTRPPITMKQQRDIALANIEKGTADLVHGTAKTMADVISFNTGLPTEQLRNFFSKEQEFAHKQVDAQAPILNQHLSARINAGVSGFVPDAVMLALLHKVPIGEGIMGQTGLTGLLNSAGRTGKVALSMTKAAIDGYELAKMKGQSNAEAIGTAGQVGLFDLGTVGVFNAGAAAYSKLASIFGKGTVKAAMEASKVEIPKVEIPKADISKDISTKDLSVKDPIMGKLTEFNSKIRNDFTKAIYGSNKFYQTIPKIQKANVDRIINEALAAGSKYPAAYDKNAVILAVQKSNAKSAQAGPEIAKSVDELNEITQKSTGSPVWQGSTNKIQQETKEAAGIALSPTQKLDAIQKAKTIEEAQKALARENRPKVDTGFRMKAKAEIKLYEVGDPLAARRNPSYGPGAAHMYDSAFTEDNMLKAMSLRPAFENQEDKDAINYWLATNNRIKDPKLVAKIKTAYELEHPDPEWRAGKEAGLIEHLHKTFATDFLNRYSGMQGKGQAGHIFRSGNYMADELRDQFDMPKSGWQQELDEFYKRYYKGKK